MAIKIGGTSIIDDNKNISNVGVVTVGVGTSGRIQVGTGTTIHGSGNVAIAGTLYALDVISGLKVESTSPSDNQTNVLITIPDIRITFNQPIGIGTTGSIFLQSQSSNTYTNLQTYGVGSTLISRTDVNRTLVITLPTPSVLEKSIPGIANTIRVIVQSPFVSNAGFPGINTTGSPIQYKFSTESVSIGSTFGGGRLICTAGGTAWVVSPYSSEVSRNFYGRGDANTRAQQVSGCTGWFVPTMAQLQNPGYVCRTYWDQYSPTVYWQNNFAQYRSGSLDFSNGSTLGGTNPFTGHNGATYCVRSFRCVAY